MQDKYSHRYTTKYIKMKLLKINGKEKNPLRQTEEINNYIQKNKDKNNHKLLIRNQENQKKYYDIFIVIKANTIKLEFFLPSENIIHHQRQIIFQTNKS